MNRLKEYWEITKTWQFLWLCIGLLGIGYVGYKIATLLIGRFDALIPMEMIVTIILTIVISFLLLKLVLKIFSKVENRWQVTYRWELIVIFIVFSITGSSSVMIGRPILKAVGLTTANLPAILYWPLFIFSSFVFYQIFLVGYGWLFGQHRFFWNMEKKMLKRFKLIKED